MEETLPLTVWIRDAWRVASDPLNLLITALSAFLIVGIGYLDFTVTWYEIGIALVTAICAELIFSNTERFISGKPLEWFFPGSAVAAALGISIFFRATSPGYFAIAAALAIASKYLIRVRGRHIFNPSNFGILVTAFIFASTTTIEFTQWGNNVVILIAISVVALLVALRAGVIVTTVSFYASYTALLYVCMWYMPSFFAAGHYGLISPSIILFASFMITDPRTTPTGFFPRIMHGFSTAATFYFLEFLGIRYALFLATFVLSLVNGFVRLMSPNGFAYGQRMRLPVNTAAFVLAICLSFYTIGSLMQGPVSASRLSPEFVFLGLEGELLQLCTANPIFKPQTGTGIIADPSAITYGAAWGDYDDDGFDDLFVSNVNKPSILYHNNGNGTFTDVTAESGLPADLTSYSAFFADYNNDGRPDLFIVENGSSKDAGRNAALVRNGLSVYRNLGGGKFKDVTNAIGLGGPELMYLRGTLSFADYDNNGYLDFIVATPGTQQTVLYPGNNAILKAVRDPRFTQNKSSVICGSDQVAQIIDAVEGLPAIRDLHMDMSSFERGGGCLRIFSTLNQKDGLGAKSFLDSQISMLTFYTPGRVLLFENHSGKFVQGDGIEAAIEGGLQRPSVATITVNRLTDYVSGMYWQPISFDYDGDGRPDILLTEDSGSNVLLHNDGNFSFHDVTRQAGVNYASSGMGVDVADYENNGLMDFFVGNAAEDYIYRGNGDGTFTNTTDTSATEIDQGSIAWGASFLDYDLDSWPDLFVANGDFISNVGSGFSIASSLTRPLLRANALYRNEHGIFENDTQNLCPGPGSSKALAVSDYDNDGTPDVFVGNVADAIFGALSDPAPGGVDELYADTITGRHYIKIRLRGMVSNSMGVGAVVHVKGNSLTQTQQLTLGSSFYSENSQAMIFGLGTSTAPVDVFVQWPSGITTTLRAVTVDQTLVLVEGSSGETEGMKDEGAR